MNAPAGRTVAGTVVVPVVDGKVTFYNHSGSVQLIADVEGWFA
ncbi:N-acetylmuramoyl-L-alanine amidase [Streptomyces sp. NPDC050600]